MAVRTAAGGVVQGGGEEEDTGLSEGERGEGRQTDGEATEEAEAEACERGCSGRGTGGRGESGGAEAGGGWGVSSQLKAARSGQAVGSVLDEEVEVVGAVEGGEEDLPPVQHKAWEAPRLRALNEVLALS